MEDAAQALATFKGTARRFELKGEVDGIAVIDDYAHHPAKIRATLEAARSRYPGPRKSGRCGSRIPTAGHKR